jgi:hypothetical protein
VTDAADVNLRFHRTPVDGAIVWLIIGPFSQRMHSKLIGDSRWA